MRIGDIRKDASITVPTKILLEVFMISSFF